MADTARLNKNDKQRKILTGFLEVGDEVGTGLEASDEVLASHVLLIRTLPGSNRLVLDEVGLLTHIDVHVADYQVVVKSNYSGIKDI